MSGSSDLQNKAIILGVKIDNRPEDFVIGKIKEYLSEDSQHRIYTPNPEICLRAERDEHYRNVLNKADINIPDGFGLKLGALILEEKLDYRITGVDLTQRILTIANENNISVGVLSKPNSLSSKTDLDNLFKAKYPNIKFNHFIGDGGEVAGINNSTTSILFVSLGAPQQEEWIDANLDAVPNIKLAIGVGGAFDFLTGKISRAPKVIRELGMEWLYRLYKQPHRLGRMKNATVDFLLTCHKWQKRTQGTFRINVMAILKNDKGEYLIQKNPRLKNHWQFPQGGVDEGESPDKTAIREACEELGLTPELLSIVKQLPGEHQYTWQRQHQLLRGYKGQKQTAYLLKFSGNDSNFHFENSDEVEAIKWLKKDELMAALHPIRREFFKKLIQYL